MATHYKHGTKKSAYSKAEMPMAMHEEKTMPMKPMMKGMAGKGGKKR